MSLSYSQSFNNQCSNINVASTTFQYNIGSGACSYAQSISAQFIPQTDLLAETSFDPSVNCVLGIKASP